MARHSYSAADAVIYSLLLVSLYVGLSVLFADWLSGQVSFLPRYSVWSFGSGLAATAAMVVAAFGLIEGVSRLVAWKNSWLRCSHGVLGGHVRHRCKSCNQERRIAAETARKKFEADRRRQEIERLAKSLHQRELRRLADLIVPSLEDLRTLTPQRFEDQIASMFERLGYRVKQTPYVRDHGRDAILWKDGTKFVVECKRYADGNTSGRRDLQILHSNMVHDRAQKGFFVTTGGFTSDALEFAQTHSIEVVDGARLLSLMVDSKSGGDDDSYKTMCRECGTVVVHQLRAPRLERCSCGHDIAPSIGLAAALTARGAAPLCECGSAMRRVHRNNRTFWGCTRFPECTRTRRLYSRAS